MSFIRRTLRAANRRLAIRIDDLCDTLNSITARVRTATADAIGETLSDIVRDAALYVLDKNSPKSSCGSSVPANSRQRTRSHPEELWDEDDEENGAYFDESQFDDDDEPQYRHRKPQLPDQMERLSLAVSAGLQIAAWWLKRRAARGLIMSMGVTRAAWPTSPVLSPAFSRS